MKLKKSFIKISQSQIREIIVLRDSCELRQSELYQLSSYVVGWKVKHLHNLSESDGKDVIKYLQTLISKNGSNGNKFQKFSLSMPAGDL